MKEPTPWPWSVVLGEQSIGERLVSVVAADGTEICNNETYYPVALKPENASLIAAAPELLAALKEMHSSFSAYQIYGHQADAIDAAEAAITKATKSPD